MAQISSARFLLISFLFVYVACVLGQDPDPAILQSCTQYKRDVFEERVGISHFIANAPITYETIDSCDGSRPLIVGGTPAEPKEFPHIARLGHRNSNNEINWFCGGTLINKRLVLTAAHCLYSPEVINVVRLGELDFSTESDDAQPEDFGVKKVIEHPAYNYSLAYHDIAILQLNRPVTFNFYKHPACLPFKSGNLSETFIAIGWGQQKFAGRPSEKLLKVQLTNLWDKCAKLNLDELPRGYDYDTQLCIGSGELKNTCNGDSGGPVLNYHEEFPCMYHVMGIVSTGLGCNEIGLPTLYTRVYHYLDWIQQQMAIYT